MAANCSTDKDFGPFVTDNCRGGFDFTLLFEQSILSLLPASVLFLGGAARLVSLVGQPRRTKSNPVRLAKVTAAAIFSAVQLALVVLWSLSPAARTKLTLPAAAINFAAGVLLSAVSWFEDALSVQPSTLLNVYLLFTLLFDAAQVRTLWLLQQKASVSLGGMAIPVALPNLLSASIAIKLSMLLLEAHGKRPYLRGPYRHLPPEPTSGIVSRSLLWWINGLFRKGLRAGKGILLAQDDLYRLDDDLSANYLYRTVYDTWSTRQQPERRFEFAWAIYRGLWRPFLKVVFPRACLIGFKFAQPFLVTRILSLVTNESPMQNQRYGLIGATGLIYLGIAVTTLHFKHSTFRFLTMFRGAAVSLIYSRSLDLQDGLYDESAAVTLMSTDVDRIVISLENVMEFWALVIEVVVGIVLLARQIGWVCVVPIAVVLISFCGSSLVTKSIGGRQKIWVEAVQKRIAVTSSMLSEMRSVKMLGLSRFLTREIQGLRVEETMKMAGYRWCILWMNVVANVPSLLAPAATFVVYAIQASARGAPIIDTTKAFTSLSIITLLTGPAGDLLSNIPYLTASFPCFDRIQKFLVTPAREDRRHIFGQMSREMGEKDSTKTTTEQHDIELTPIASIAPVAMPQINAAEESRNPLAVLVEDLSVRPSDTASLVLNNISFRVKQGSTTMILGPVGCGKTTLLKAILGEVPYESGQVTVSTRQMAFCSQVPWLPNTTIKQAICGPTAREVDEDWYQVTLKSCALDRDLSMMARGDNTEIGAGSTELSGGQKQRVALARAVYSRASIIVLDDVLSALDAKTTRIVVERLFGREHGVFRRLGSAVILVTHAAKFISYADQVLVVDSEGNIKKHEGKAHLHDATREASETSVNRDDEPDTLKRFANAEIKPTAAEVQKENQVRDLSRATGDIAIYKYFFRTCGFWMPLLFFAVTLAEVAFRSLGPVLLNFWSAADGRQIALYATLYFVLAIGGSICNIGSIWTCLIRISPRTAQKMHYVVLSTVMRAPASYLSQTDTGSILSRFSQDMTIIEGQLGIAVLITTGALFQSIGDAALIATGSSYMAATIPLLIAAIVCLQYVYLRTSRQLRLLDLENRSPLYSHFVETLDGLGIIRAFGWEAENVDRNKTLLDFSQRPYYLLYCIQRWLNLVLDLIVAGEAVLVVGLALGVRSSTTAGLLGISLNNVLTFSQSLTTVVTGYTQLETSLGSVARVKSFEAGVLPEDKKEEIAQPFATWPDKGAVQFNGVTASHNPAAVAVRDITLEIKPGQKIGVCGRTGSGKSSLVGTLLRLLEINQGSVMIDGLDLATIPRETIRERLIAIPQDPLILAGSSVRRNLDPEGDHADSEIIASLERVGLWTSLLREQEGGLEAGITASSLSRGQQQLFALARAVLKAGHTGGKILLLDEATSSVDGETDNTIQKVLQEDFADCTVVAVAHRIHTVMGCDVAVVMEDGHIVEIGAPQELVQKPNGRFAGLAKSSAM